MTKTLLTALLILTTTYFSALAHSQTDSIIVEGIGQVIIDEIQGKIRASVITNAESPDQAITQNNQKVNSVVSALQSVGINEQDIQTSAFSLYPIYSRLQGEQTLTGYGVNNGINIVVNTSMEIGPILELIIQAGVNRVDSVKFLPIDIDLLTRQALRKATTDAKNKASVLAAASGVSLGKVSKIDTVNSFNDSSIVRAANAGISSDSNNSVLPGTNYFSAKVTITYLIEE